MTIFTNHLDSVWQWNIDRFEVTSHLQILAIVAMSYDELQKKAEEEEEAALAEEEAMRVSE